MFKKLNNKGDTLAIVLIGIFVLSILGTLILGLTATNYRMKINDKQSESAFYYAEKGMDELYTNFGSDVMDAITTSYKNAVEKVIYSKDAGNASADSAQVEFEKGVKAAVSNDFKKGSAGVQELIDKVNATGSGYITQVNGYNIVMFSPGNEPLEIKYLRTVVDASGNASEEEVSNINQIEKIKINNVGVLCNSTQGYSAAIVSDFEITIPNIELNFEETKPAGASLDNLAKYALVCEGFNLHPDAITTAGPGRSLSPIIIADNQDVTITGSVYADGTVYTPVEKKATHTTTNDITYYENSNAIIAKNPSITVGNGAKLNMNSKVLYCQNDFVLNTDSSAVINNKDKDGSVDRKNSLQFFVNNIITARNTRNASLSILGGNTIVRDDLELNGDHSTINIRGNYFGYGFRTNDGSTEAPSNTVSVFPDGVTTTTNEHEKSSAIIVNGKEASVSLANLSKLVLLGRAYIDLDEMGTNTSYMTGESVSFKGNQDAYLATVTNELAGSDITENPIAYSSLDTILNGRLSNGTGASISDLRLNPDKVVAKRAGNDVYFYEKNNDPQSQTQYFSDIFTNSADPVNQAKIDTIRKQVGPDGLDVRSFQIRPTQYYLVGNVMNVGKTVAGATEISYPVTGNNMSSFSPETFVNVVNNRIANLSPALVDLSEKDNYVLGTDDTMDSTLVSNAPNPYEYYVDRKKLLETYGTGRHEKGIEMNSDGSGNASIFETTQERAKTLTAELKQLLVDTGACTMAQLNDGSYQVGIVISNEQGSGSINTAVKYDAGVVVGESSYSIQKNFTGLILNNGEMRIQRWDNQPITINANEEVVSWMFENIPALNKILSAGLTTGNGSSGDGVVVGDNSIRYTDIIKKSNWRKAIS